MYVCMYVSRPKMITVSLNIFDAIVRLLPTIY